MYLADTNLLSEPRQKYPEPRVLTWLAQHEDELFLSAISIGEIQAGISSLAAGKKKNALQEWLGNLLEKHHDAILAFDESVALRWGELDAELVRKGRKIPIEDSYVAATALFHNLIVATRNETDFAGTGVKVVNPWKYL